MSELIIRELMSDAPAREAARPCDLLQKGEVDVGRHHLQRQSTPHGEYGREQRFQLGHSLLPKSPHVNGAWEGENPGRRRPRDWSRRPSQSHRRQLLRPILNIVVSPRWKPACLITTTPRRRLTIPPSLSR